VSDVTVVVLNRPRHAELLQELRDVGARIRLIQDGDVAAAIETTRPGTGIDILMGIGGTPEGVITAAAMICLGGAIQGQLYPKDEAERQGAIAKGHDLSKILFAKDLINSDDVFLSATGITDGELLRGIRHTRFGAISHSIVMRGESHTVRIIETEHNIRD
jgi:fructose-1,6-bisphosphatase II